MTNTEVDRNAVRLSSSTTEGSDRQTGKAQRKTLRETEMQSVSRATRQKTEI